MARLAAIVNYLFSLQTMPVDESDEIKRTEEITGAYINQYNVDESEFRNTLSCKMAPFFDVFWNSVKCFPQTRTQHHSVNHLFSYAKSRKAFKNFCRTSATDIWKDKDGDEKYVREKN